LPTKRIFVIVTLNGAFSLSCGKGKVFCNGPFALHRQQPEKDTVFIRLQAAAYNDFFIISCGL